MARPKDKPVPEDDYGLLVKGKHVNEYKKEFAKIAGVSPEEVRVQFIRNRDNGQVEDISCTVKASGKYNKAYRMGIKAIRVKEVFAPMAGDPTALPTEPMTRREMEATVTFGPDLNRARATIRTLLPIADNMTPEAVSTIILAAMEDRVFMNRSHRDPNEEGSLSKHQKPHAVELAITGAVTRAIDLGTGGGYAVANDLDEPEESERISGDLDDVEEEAIPGATKIEACEVLKSSIDAGIEEVGVEEVIAFISFDGDEEKLRELLKNYVLDGEQSLLEDMLIAVQQCVNAKNA